MKEGRRLVWGVNGGMEMGDGGRRGRGAQNDEAVSERNGLS